MIQPPPTDLWEVKQVQKTAWFLLSSRCRSHPMLTNEVLHSAHGGIEMCVFPSGIREIRIPPKTKARKDESVSG